MTDAQQENQDEVAAKAINEEEQNAEAPVAPAAEAEKPKEEKAEEPKYRVITFSDQMKAYNWLLWRCPAEYHFTAGIDRTTGQPCVNITLPA